MTPDLTGTPARALILSQKHGIWCLVDADDWDWIVATQWNYGWHSHTRWKYYAKRNIGPARSTVYLHREIMLRKLPLDLDELPLFHADHINGQSLDNRRCNLRWLTPTENGRHRVTLVPTLDEIVAQLLAEAAAAPALEAIPF